MVNSIKIKTNSKTWAKINLIIKIVETVNKHGNLLDNSIKTKIN